jgi:hypothetical protein
MMTNPSAPAINVNANSPAATVTIVSAASPAAIAIAGIAGAIYLIYTNWDAAASGIKSTKFFYVLRLYHFLYETSRLTAKRAN